MADQELTISDDELEAASIAYVSARYAGEADKWRRNFPQAWQDLCARMRVALIAAAKMRALAAPP